jgi:hypothetical protein
MIRFAFTYVLHTEFWWCGCGIGGGSFVVGDRYEEIGTKIMLLDCIWR